MLLLTIDHLFGLWKYIDKIKLNLSTDISFNITALYIEKIVLIK